ncbi:hypothetical protein LCGC14_1388630, partial [marine sediment metagenome]
MYGDGPPKCLDCGKQLLYGHKRCRKHAFRGELNPNYKGIINKVCKVCKKEFFVIPKIVILFLGIIYVMSQRTGMGFTSFFLIGAAGITMIYWVQVLKKMTKDQKPKYRAREQETKSWVYDLIKGDEEVVFVAEVPGPEDKVM